MRTGFKAAKVLFNFGGVLATIFTRWVWTLSLSLSLSL